MLETTSPSLASTHSLRPVNHPSAGPPRASDGRVWLDRKQVASGEDSLRDEDRVEGLGEAAVDRGVCNGLYDLYRAQSDVERRVDMNRKLWLATAEAVSMLMVTSWRCSGRSPAQCHRLTASILRV